MARFVDLDDEYSQEQQIAAWQEAGKPLVLPENGTAVMVVGGDGDRSVIVPARRFPSRKSTVTDKPREEDTAELGQDKEEMAHSAMAEAFHCYPYETPSLSTDYDGAFFCFFCTPQNKEN